MTKRSRRRASGKKQSSGCLGTGVVVIVLILLGGFFLLTGEDPLGIFEPPATPTPPAETIEGDWWQVHFTNPQPDGTAVDLRGSVAERLIGHINQAQSSIHIVSFEFNLPPVADALIAARQRGLDVRFVTDDESGIEADEDDGLKLFPKMEEAGIGLRDDDRGALMHNKFWIFDQQTVWTGSTNITENGIFRNNNNVIVINSPRVAAMYEREFDEMWNGQFGPTSPSTRDSQQTTINGVPVQVLFGSEDKAMPDLVDLVDGAQQSVRFMAFSFTRDDLGDAMLSRAEAGLNVQGIFEARGSETEFSELPRFFCAGLAVRQDGNPRAMHHKVIIIDGQKVVTGSFNFSNNAEENNDENLVIIADPNLAAHYLQEFERRWAEAVAPSRGEMGC